MGPSDWLSIPGRPREGFTADEIVIPPGSERVYRDNDFRGALVLVAAGAVELESQHGVRRRFEAQSLLWLSGMGLRWLRNPGAVPATLVAISRQQARARPDPGHGAPIPVRDHPGA